MYQKIIMLRQYKGKFIALNVYIRKKEPPLPIFMNWVPTGKNLHQST